MNKLPRFTRRSDIPLLLRGQDRSARSFKVPVRRHCEKQKSPACLSAAFWLALRFHHPRRADAVRPVTLSNTLLRNDDNSTGLVSTGFTLNFFGFTSTQLYVNNNGNATFTGPLGTFTPFALAGANTRIIAPSFADVDTRNLASGVTQYGQVANIDGRSAFVVNWIGVGYFDQEADKLNEFQLVLINRSDTGAGNFDIEFNYDQLQWETGEASGGVGGLGGFPARVLFERHGHLVELPGSGVPCRSSTAAPEFGRQPASLGVAGRYIFNVRNGSVVPPPPGRSERRRWCLSPGLAGIAAGSAGGTKSRKTKRA